MRSKEPLTDKPIKGLAPDQAPEIPRRPKKEPVAESNGVTTNGKHTLDTDSAPKALKRAREDEPDAPSSKKAKTTTQGDDDDVVLVSDEPGTGAIVIDDD